MTTVLAFVLALPVVWCLGYRAHAHTTDRRQALVAEATARPVDPHPAVVADEIALGLQALAEACCERWWTSAGAEHDGPCTSRWATAVACCPECAVAPGTPCHEDGQPRAHAHDRRIQEAKEAQP
ncbi:hypothetical protein [Streptomyces sp. cmx-10-25]|uniref:hypothetical protein n=1 Tax=Streptomyces sp. cmx-10-25 TaxID=2790919 RepID=UPI0039818EB0